MRTNVARAPKPAQFTHEGARSAPVSDLAELRRSVMAAMLWEDSFYESGSQTADRIAALVKTLPFADVAAVAVEARERFHLRHVPLWLIVCLLRARKESGRAMGDLIFNVIQRADEPGELLAMYWKAQPDAPITKQMKVGLSRALKKFNAYQLAKYNRDTTVKLRDVLFLVHAKPRDEALFKRLADDTLDTPETWEVLLSKGGDKKAVFEHLMLDRKLGGLAFLRNLRGMLEANVDEDLIREYGYVVDVSRVLPARFVAAARAAPRLEDMLEQMMFRGAKDLDKLAGKTAILIDHSGSMAAVVSGKSDLTRFDAAASLAVQAREICEVARVFAFSDECKEVAPRRGFALIDLLAKSMDAQGTRLGLAVEKVYRDFPDCERLIVVTDEQSADRPHEPRGRGYIINVANFAHGIGYGHWITINGWSEAVLDYIREHEKEAD